MAAAVSGLIVLLASPSTLYADLTGGPDSDYLVTSHDNIPNFCKTPTITSTATGNWSNPAIWDLGRIPGSTDVIRIGTGTTVTFNMGNGSGSCVGIAGKLAFSTSSSTKLTATNIIVYPTGELTVGTESQPVSSGVTAEIVIRDTALDTIDDGSGIFDPSQYGTALLGFGKVTMYGDAKTQTFAQLTQEPLAGQTQLVLSGSLAGWRAGDRLVIPDTRALTLSQLNAFVPSSGQWEEVTIQSVSGNTVTLTGALAFNHRGYHDFNDNIEFMPHVGNLSRNVIIRSENPAGTRGHILFTARATVDLDYVRFLNLGRTLNSALNNTTFSGTGGVTHIGTNQIGRYSLHAHHLIGPVTTPAHGYQFRIRGNAIDFGTDAHNFKWGIAVHNSHYGLIEQNIVYNFMGAGIAVEDGSETSNRFNRNFVIRGSGSGDRGDGRGMTDLGHDGVCFWSRSVANYVTNNVCADALNTTAGISGAEASYGYKFFQTQLGNVTIPLVQGNDPQTAGQGQTVNGHSRPVAQFENNVVYTSASGLTYWHVGAQGNSTVGTSESVFKNLIAWNISNRGVFHYHGALVTHDGLKVRGGLIGWGGNDYWADRIIIKNADIQNAAAGINFSTRVGSPQGQADETIQDSYLRNTTNIQVETMWSSEHTATLLQPRKIVIDNVNFASPPSASNYKAIDMMYSASPVRTVVQTDEVFVYDYDQSPGVDFQVYYPEQGSGSTIPVSVVSNWYTSNDPGNACASAPSTQLHTLGCYRRVVGCPDSGLTNQQCADTWGYAIGGAIAPCSDTTTHPEIDGYVCSIRAPVISSLSPADGATGVSTGATLSIVFDEATGYSGTGYVTIHKASDNSIVTRVNTASGSVTGSGTLKQSISLSVSLAYNTAYYVQIDGNAFPDASGNNFAGISDTTTWNFTTGGDTSRPIIAGLSPADNATGVSTAATLQITFNETIGKTGTGYITLRKASDSSIVERINTATGSVTGSGTSTITVALSSALTNGTAYYVQIDGNAFPDTSGNFFAGISDTTTWNFTAVADLPVISTLSPADNATGVSTGTTLQIVFDQAIAKTGTGYLTIYKSSDNSIVERINTATGSVTGSGTSTITISLASPLEYSTTYHVRIDGRAFPNAAGNYFAGIADSTTWNFTTDESPASWFNPSWLYRKRITIDRTNVSANLTDFPLLVKISSDSDVGGAARSDGYDLRFTASDGVTELPYDRETFAVTGSTATGAVWVKTSISSTSPTVLYMYYGNASAADGKATTSVWDSNFKSVWHLNEDPTGGARAIVDVTATGSGTAVNMESGDLQTGKIGRALNFDGVDEKVNVSATTSLTTSWTVGAWFKKGALNFRSITRHSATGIPSLRVDTTSSRLTYFDGAADKSANNGWSQNQWTHFVATHDGTVVRVYSNGLLAGSGASTRSQGALTNIGSYGTSAFFDGLIDEVRVSNTPRSASWIKFEYYNMNEADNELSISGPEAYSTDTTPPAVQSLSPADNATGVSTTANLVLTFDDTTRAGTGTVAIKRASDASTIETITVSGALLSGNGSTQLTLDPSVTLSGSTVYYITWSANAFKDISGNHVAAQSSTSYWNFTSLDSTPPSISTLSPADGATDVAITADLVVTFDEAVTPVSGNVTIKKTSDNSIVEVINVLDGPVTGGGTETITVNPLFSLENATGYYVQIDATAFDDLGGNGFAGIGNTTTWNFTTTAAADTTAPTVQSLSPADGATDVSTTANLILTFDEETRAGTGTLTIKNASDDSTVETITVSGALLSGNASTQLTLDPSTSLVEGTSYYVIWSANAFKDPFGNHAAAQSSTSYWDFTTAVASSEASSSSSSSARSDESPRSGGGRGSDTNMAKLVSKAKEAILAHFNAPTTAPEQSEQTKDAEPPVSPVRPTKRITSVADREERRRKAIEKIAEQEQTLLAVVGDEYVVYRDVPRAAWYAPYVSYVVQEGIAEGYKDTVGNLTGEFGVAKPITYGEVLKMALEAAGSKAGGGVPRNVSARNSWAAPYVKEAENRKLSVYAPSLNVNDPAGRGAVIRTILEVLAFPIANQPATFRDVPESDPNAKAIATAAFFGLVTGDTDKDGKPLNTFRPRDPMNRAEVTKIISLAREILKR